MPHVMGHEENGPMANEDEPQPAVENEKGNGSGENGDEHGAADVTAGVESDRHAQPVDTEEPPRLAFPVVGIGASAGGLEAIIEFISAMRHDAGMAYVVIQHLPPDRESLVAEI